MHLHALQRKRIFLGVHFVFFLYLIAWKDQSPSVPLASSISVDLVGGLVSESVEKRGKKNDTDDLVRWLWNSSCLLLRKAAAWAGLRRRRRRAGRSRSRIGWRRWWASPAIRRCCATRASARTTRRTFGSIWPPTTSTRSAGAPPRASPSSRRGPSRYLSSFSWTRRENEPLRYWYRKKSTTFGPLRLGQMTSVETWAEAIHRHHGNNLATTLLTHGIVVWIVLFLYETRYRVGKRDQSDGVGYQFKNNDMFWHWWNEV